MKRSSEKRWRSASLLSSALLAAAMFAAPQVALAEDIAEGQEQQAVVEVQAQEQVVCEAPAVEVSEAPVVEVPVAEAPVVETPAVETPADPVVEAPSEEAAVAAEATDTIEATMQAAVAADDQAAEGEQSAAPAKEDAALEQAGEEDAFDGKTFIIESGKSNPQVLDAKGGKTTNGTNIQQWTYNGSAAQKYTFEKSSETDEALNTYYSILLQGTQQALDVRNGGNSGSNVNLYQKNGTDAQLWRLEEVSKGFFKIISKLSEKYGTELVLDIAGGSTSNGGNIQLYRSNNSAAQRFYLIDTKPVVEHEALKNGDGLYNLGSAVSTNYVLDVSGGAVTNSANIQIYSKNNTPAQQVYFESDSDGFYTITFMNSGRVLDLAGGKPIPGTNVQQYARNNTDAQKWGVQYKSGDSFVLVNKATGLVLDIAGGKIANSTNINGWRSNDSKAQQFKVTKVDFLNNGIYEIHLLRDNSMVIDIKGGSAADGATAQVYKSNGSLAQKYGVEKVSDNIYRIRTAASGGWLSAKAGSTTGVEQTGNQSTAASPSNEWEIVWNGSYFSLKNLRTGNYLQTDDGKFTAQTKIQSGYAKTDGSQYFVFKPTKLVSAGLYVIKSGKTSYVVDVTNGSTASGTQLQTWKANNSAAQKWMFETSGTGFKITNINSGKVLTVSGNNIVQSGSTSSNSQIWEAKIADGGGVAFVNKGTGKALNLNGSRANGTKLTQAAYTGSAARQVWTLENSNGWVQVNSRWYFYYSGKYSQKVGTRKEFSSTTKSTWDRIRGASNNSRWVDPETHAKRTGSKYLITINNTACRTTVFEGKSGDWEPLLDWSCCVGSVPTGGATATGDFCIRRKGYRMGQYPYEYYWSEFYFNTAAYSDPDAPGEGQRFHSILMNGGPNSSAYDGRLGMAISHGCVRLAVANAKFIYDNCPIGTRVYSFR